MAVSIGKNESLELDEQQYDLTKLTLGLGWRAKNKGGLFSRLKGREAVDLDALALMLGTNGKVRDENDVIYFGNLRSTDGSVEHSGDDLSGKGRGDSEQIVIHLQALPSHFHKVVFAVIIHEAKKRELHFGMLDNAYVRVLDATAQEVVRFDLSHDPSYDGAACILMGELSRSSTNWSFTGLGTTLDVERISGIAIKYA